MQGWDLQLVGAFTVCVGTALGQPQAVPRVPTGIHLLLVIGLGNPLENALGSCGPVGHPGHWSKLVVLRKPSKTVTCWDQVSFRAGREWFGRQLEWKALVDVQV